MFLDSLGLMSAITARSFRSYTDEWLWQYCPQVDEIGLIVAAHIQNHLLR